MIAVRLVDPEPDLQGRTKSPRAARVRPEPDDTGVSRPVRVVDEHTMVLGEARVEGERQEAPLATAGDEIGDVQERGRLHLPVLDDPDHPALFDDVETARIGPCRREVHGVREPEATGARRSAPKREPRSSRQEKTLDERQIEQLLENGKSDDDDSVKVNIQSKEEEETNKESTKQDNSGAVDANRTESPAKDNPFVNNDPVDKDSDSDQSV